MARKNNKASRRGGDGATAYKHPVPGQGEILDTLSAAGSPQSFDALAERFGVTGKQQRAALGRRLAAMVRAGQVLKNRNADYCLVERLNLITGTVSAHRDGYGFVTPDSGGDDVYLSAREMRPVFDGDRVAVRPGRRDRRGRREGRLVDILERNTVEVAGQYIRERGIGLVVPDNPKVIHRVLIPPRRSNGAKHGQMVIARLLDYPTSSQQATGEITAILGQPGERGMATDLAIHAHAIPHDWPDEVEAAAESFGSTVPRKAKAGRTDLRELPLVTIDGADARDFDDAVYAEPDDDGWRLLVAIADVAHYVTPDGAIDAEAARRGTSVYFPDRVVPMLPEVLSNGLCSLNPKVDRLCLVCDMQVQRDGKVARSRFYNGLMRSARRLTYEDAARFIERRGKPARLPDGVAGSLTSLAALYRAFARARKRRGALELDIPQRRIELDADGNVRAIESRDRNDAHRLIEECMIAANVEAARLLARHRLPGLYRVHAKPKSERFDAFRDYLLALGFKVPLAEDVRPQDFARLLDAVADRPDSHAISMTLLRSMAHAEYTPENIGHFGLALPRYSHFTSPIRRYPDLLLHRAIKHIVAKGKPGQVSLQPRPDGALRAYHVLCRTARRGRDPRSGRMAGLPVHAGQDRPGISWHRFECHRVWSVRDARRLFD